MTKKPLDLNRRYILLGYYDMIEKGPASGACIHNKVQYLTVLKMCLEMGIDIDDGYEYKIKKLIHRLYGDVQDFYTG